MKNLESIAQDLFNKIRGRFPTVTIGDEGGKVTNVPTEARYFDFEYKESGKTLGKVSISLDEDNIAVMYSDDFVANEDSMTRNNWYNFLKELRSFSKKRLLNFDTRNITKSNLDRRDYNFLAKTRAGEDNMNESTMYGTSRTSFQKIGNARLSIKHTQPVNQESAADRTRHISSIYVESSEGERFKYPYKHLSGARAIARHVSEGGTLYDDFGSHIVGMSEELSKLRKFKTYVNRSSVMAEGLEGYMGAIAERMDTIRKTLKGLQRETVYRETFEGFEKPVVEDVPEDVAENWIDQLTIRQFNEELKDVFPFVYKVVSEYTKTKELGPEDLIDEAPLTSPRPQERPESDDEMDIRQRGNLDRVRGPAGTVKVRPGMTIAAIARAFNDQNNMGGDLKEFEREIMQMNNISNPASLQVGQVLRIPYTMGTGRDGASRGLPPGGFTAYENEIEDAFEEIMGQFSEKEVCKECGNPSWRTLPEEKQKGVDGKVCWKGYRREGTKMKGGRRVDNCVKVGEGEEEDVPVGVEAEIEQFLATNPKNGDDLQALHHKAVMDKHKELDDYLTFLYDYVADQTGAAGTEELGVYDEMLDLLIQMMKDKGWREGNAYAHAVRKAKMDGKKRGDKVKGPDGDEITIEKDEKTPLGEFILSYFDYTSGQFPKGETAVLTMVEKDYGEQFIEPAKQFIERINNRVAEVMGYKDTEMDESGLQYYIGKKKYGKDGMKKLAQAGRNGASQEKLGRIKDQYEKESEDLRRLAGLR